MAYLDKGDRMANYPIDKRLWKWTEKTNYSSFLGLNIYINGETVAQ
jgi:hypothetical protein